MYIYLANTNFLFLFTYGLVKFGNTPPPIFFQLKCGKS